MYESLKHTKSNSTQKTSESSRIHSPLSITDNRLETTQQLKMWNKDRLPESFKNKKWFIDNSPIHGKGVMAGKGLKKEEKLGKVASLDKNIGVDITSDFGALINHQSNKNANASIKKEGTNFFLKTNEAIKEGEEITTDYDTAGPYFAKSKSSYKDM
ncbi:SET domain-containing protein [Tenacibaculum sp. ZS6-P6]|uniref:SET domain-containing protein n=1 Tax=Tenacibaculum sp. ZS6-P6 TaxID=3447503 RepID=UPI003F9BA355